MDAREIYEFWLTDSYFDEKTKEELRGIAAVSYTHLYHTILAGHGRQGVRRVLRLYGI